MIAMAPTMAKPMLSLLRAALIALLTLVAFAATPATARDRVVDLDPFYEQLEPYGQWFEHPVWGTVWRPRVDQDWRPYARGMWLYTDEFGWYWEAEEPWGWATFHYGRWLIAEDGAWIWLPDNEWGPAWVAWRASDEFVGWAPLPPDAHWGADGELLFDAAFYSAPRYHSVWCFVRPHQLILTGLHRYLVSPRHADAVFRSSRPFRAHHKLDGRFVNAGFDVRRFERMTGRPVVRLRIKTVDSPQAASLGRGRAHGAEISVYKPRFVEQPQGRARIHRPGGDGPRAPRRPRARAWSRHWAREPRARRPDRPKPALADADPRTEPGASAGPPRVAHHRVEVDRRRVGRHRQVPPPTWMRTRLQRGRRQSSRRAHARPASALAMAPIAVGSRCLRPPQGRQPATAEGRRPASISALTAVRRQAPSAVRHTACHKARRGPSPRRGRRRVLSLRRRPGPPACARPHRPKGRPCGHPRPTRSAARRRAKRTTTRDRDRLLTGGAAAGGGTAHIAAPVAARYQAGYAAQDQSPQSHRHRRPCRPRCAHARR